jgi:hypothetical protein
MTVQRGSDPAVVPRADEERVVPEKHNFDKNFSDPGNEPSDNETVWDPVVEAKARRK